MLSFPWYRSPALPGKVPKLLSKEFSIILSSSLELFKRHVKVVLRDVT